LKSFIFCGHIVKTIRLNTRSEWTPPYVEHFVTHNDFGHINTPSQNEPHNFEHWTQIPERSIEMTLVTLNICVSHSMSTTVTSQFILISSYSNCNAFKCCSKKKRLKPWVGRESTPKKISREGIARFGQSFVRACIVKYSVSVYTIINWKKNKSEIINSIFEFINLD